MLPKPSVMDNETAIIDQQHQQPKFELVINYNANNAKDVEKLQAWIDKIKDKIKIYNPQITNWNVQGVA